MGRLHVIARMIKPIVRFGWNVDIRLNRGTALFVWPLLELSRFRVSLTSQSAIRFVDSFN